MTENPERPRARVTTLQRLTVGVLAIVFLIVLVVQFLPAGDSSQPIDSGARPPDVPSQPAAARRGADAQAKNGGPKPPTLDHPWPAFSLATVLEFDPFAKPTSLAADRGGIQQGGDVGKATLQKSEDAEKKRIERERVLAEVRKEVVQAIVGTDRGFVAIVGTRTIHVGDRLHGFLVKEIRADGIILEDNHD
jgi:hypothetical protein